MCPILTKLREAVKGRRPAMELAVGVICLMSMAIGAPEKGLKRTEPMNIQQLRQLGREGLIRLAVEEVRKQAPDFELQAFDTIRVRTRDGVIVVRFEMNVQVLAGGTTAITSAGPLQNTLEVTFTGQECTINPEPRHLYPYTSAARAALRELEAAGLPVRASEYVRRIKVEDLGDAWAVTIYRPARDGYTGGAEQYRVDKRTRQSTLRWHEHPMKQPVSDISGEAIHSEDDWEEIQ